MNYVPLSEILAEQPRNGWSPPAAHHADKGVPVLTLSAVTGFVYNRLKIKHTSATTDDGAHYWLKEGELLLTRSNTPNLVGHVAIYDGTPFPAICPDLIMKMTVDPTKASTRYIYYYLRSVRARRHFTGRARGASGSMVKVNKGIVQETPIPLPPIAEQKRLAAILDAADALRAKRQQALANLDDLLQSTFLTLFGDPVTNPMGWDTIQFSKIGKFVSGATPSKKRDDFWKGNIPWVSPKDMKRERIGGSIDHISGTALEETNIKLIKPNHLLIVVRGMILAHSFPVGINTVPVTFNQDMKAICPIEDALPLFLLACLKAQKRQVLAIVSTAGHGTKKFDQKAMAETLIPLPPLPLQQRFAAIVEKIEAQKARHRAHLAELDTLFASLQSRAFSGEL